MNWVVTGVVLAAARLEEDAGVALLSDATDVALLGVLTFVSTAGLNVHLECEQLYSAI